MTSPTFDSFLKLAFQISFKQQNNDLALLESNCTQSIKSEFYLTNQKQILISSQVRVLDRNKIYYHG